MAKIIGVRFKNAGKLFYFNPGELWPSAGDDVIVETARGVEFGQVIMGLREVSDTAIAAPLRPVLRIANDADRAHVRENEKFCEEAFTICQQKIDEHQLEMKLVGVEETFDNAKILFYFTANGRVDFRALVKDLASVFHTRIELRQIGVRDEAKMLGGLGPCGRPICCGSFLGDFQPVSIKMAKEQNLSLNPTKISGVCGRLMCCLKFEQDHYEQTRRRMPRIGRSIETPDGEGVIVDINVLKETVTVRMVKGDTAENKEYDLEQLHWNPPVSSGDMPEPKERTAAVYRSDEEPKKTDWSEEQADFVPEEQPAEETRGMHSRRTRPVNGSDRESKDDVSKKSQIVNEKPKTKTESGTPKTESTGASDWLKAVEDALNATQKDEQ